MADAFSSSPPDALVAPIVSATAITASASEIPATRGIHCNSAGSITVQFVGDTTTVSLSVLAGASYPYRVNKVTAGTGVVALY